MGVAGVVLARHGREGVASAEGVTALAWEPLGVVIMRAVQAISGHALLLELHQTLDLV